MKELLGTYRPGVLKIRLVFNRNDITGIVKNSLVFKATYSLVETFQEIKDFLIFKKKQQEQEGCSGKTILLNFNRELLKGFRRPASVWKMPGISTCTRTIPCLLYTSSKVKTCIFDSCPGIDWETLLGRCTGVELSLIHI